MPSVCGECDEAFINVGDCAGAAFVCLFQTEKGTLCMSQREKGGEGESTLALL